MVSSEVFISCSFIKAKKEQEDLEADYYEDDEDPEKPKRPKKSLYHCNGLHAVHQLNTGENCVMIQAI